ncbi:hypothetical protein PF005_g25748 [Phytophthora fragariae]|uniref:Uncharacterized protein n=2 Tax=Phytophthora TaxID=4783 RepID=A0A6A3WFF6_9STRA|nr:hypothetical protein PF003_g14848 [Phytophthora fragariae]KAE9013889.1 hypothetical protein PR002_g14391 [Phytophthora rubi]KAE9073471.1 hypothetical protein PF007_g25793 [Phytophthora fragariae]KAE9174685.1 hypothetical protein PF005_g25748 [Phytophthora fragariae]KAE9181250.1 hypothetical protein PF004_g24602 [Phytophthora fragariae]
MDSAPAAQDTGSATLSSMRSTRSSTGQPQRQDERGGVRHVQVLRGESSADATRKEKACIQHKAKKHLIRYCDFQLYLDF